MKLPNSNKAIIDDEKLAGYCLNPNHTDGQDKARVFKSALGLTIDDANELKNALLYHFSLIVRDLITIKIGD